MDASDPTGHAGPTALSALLDVVPDATLGLDPDGTILLCNGQAAAVFDYPKGR